MASEIMSVQAFESGGRLVKDQPQVAQVTAVEMDGKLYRTEDDAHKAKAVAALSSLLLAGGRAPFMATPRLLENARAVAAILTAYADATE